MAIIANPDIRKPASPPTREYEDYIARALATQGGHLSIGRGGATLYFERGWLSGCHEDRIKAEAIAAGLPVIDHDVMNRGATRAPGLLRLPIDADPAELVGSMLSWLASRGQAA